MFWGIAGLLVGVIIALQLTFPNIFYFPELGWTNFGRLRPLHTSAVIFAFGGSALFATSYWVVQRTCQTPLFAPGEQDFSDVRVHRRLRELSPKVWAAMDRLQPPADTLLLSRALNPAKR